MDTIRRFAMCTAVAMMCSHLSADPVQLTVTVRDPDGNPVQGAGVQYSYGFDSELIPAPPLLTDAAGQISTAINTPMPLPVRGVIALDYGLMEGETTLQTLRR